MHITVSRAIEGITLNGDEFLLEDSGEKMGFKSKEIALSFFGAGDEHELMNWGMTLHEENDDE